MADPFRRRHVMLVAARVTSAGGAHPGRCLISAIQAAGYDGDTFGEVSGNLPDLFG